MREILFRGKRIDNGDWVEGDLIHDRNSDRVLIHTTKINISGTDAMVVSSHGVTFGRMSGIEVDPETVGQFTGLIDKNGKKIFEGDILKNLHNLHSTVIWDDGCFVADPVCELCAPYITNEAFEIIGNIHEQKKPKLKNYE